MEVIKNYLESIFLAYPNTPETQRAKEELWAMMEDRFGELIREGHNENEAVGIVLGEFGNVEEIMRDLGYGGREETANFHSAEEFSSAAGDTGKENSGEKTVTYQEAVEYVQEMEKAGIKIGLGVWMCVASPSVLLLMLGLSFSRVISQQAAMALGITAAAVLVAAAVGLFLYSGIRVQKYGVLKEEMFWMDGATRQYMEELRDAFRPVFTAHVIVGTVICIISVIPILAGAVLSGAEEVMLPSISLSLILAGLGVFFFINAGCRHSCYTVLLQEKEYSREKKEKKRNGWKSFEDTYWILVTALYFLISFGTRRWGSTWILWIVAAAFNEFMGKRMRRRR